MERLSVLHPFVLILLFTSAALTALAVRLLQRNRWQRVRLVFGALVASVSVWTFGDFLQHVTSRQLADLWASLRYLGICPVGALWLLLAYLYTGGAWRTARRFLPFLLLPPLLSYALLLTNPWHHLFFTHSLVRFTENQVFGPAYWFHTGFSYLYLAVGMVLYVTSFVRTREPLYRKQTLIMILGCLVPLIGNVLFIFRIVSLRVDITPLLLSVTVVLYGIGIFRLAMIDMRPIAMESILHNLHAGVLIIDRSGLVVGTNPYFYELFNLRRDIVGVPLVELKQLMLPQVREPERFAAWIAEILVAPVREGRISLELGPGDQAVDVKYAPIYEDQRVQLGGILVLHDMTEWNRLNRSLQRERAELERNNEEIERVNEELRRKNEELERFNRFAVSREMKMIELKRRVKQLEGGQKE